MRISVMTCVGPMHSTGGLQDHAATLATGLVRAGHEVEVITTAHPDRLTELELDGARWIFVDAPAHHLDPVWLRRSTETFLARHSDAPYDVVDSESSAGLGLVRAGLHREVPFVVTFHGNFLTHARAYGRRAAAARSPRPLLRELKGLSVLALRDHFPRGNWRLFRDCEAIVPSAAQRADTIRSHLLRPERTHVVPNGIDLTVWKPGPRAEARRELGLGEDVVVFASVGRLNRGKGIDDALKSLADLKRSGLEARLLVAGDGPEEQPLRQLVGELGLDDAVTFTGRLDHAGVRRVMNAADALVFPTKHSEAAPLVLLQALACRLPVIASRIGAIPEVVGDDAAVLVPPGDAPALTSAMAETATDRALRERLAAAGHSLVVDRYSLEAMLRQTMRVFESATARLG